MTTQRPRGTVKYDNSGRVVLITGGCSGIGLSIVNAFAESGGIVYCFDIDHQNSDSLPEDVTYLKGDVSSETDCVAAVNQIMHASDGIDVLINNAAIQPKSSYAPIHTIGTDTWQRMTSINLAGYYLMAKQVLPVMLRQQSGVILNMASGQAHHTARQVGVYGPIKAANVMQSRQWGIEYARDGIRVVSLSPGAIDTPLVRATLEEQGGADALANRHPIGRIGKSEEVAAAALWLCSDDASFVTATDLEVDGGLGAFGAFADPY